MIEQWMIADMNHEREMLMWFMRQKRCHQIQSQLMTCLNDVVYWLVTPEIQKYPYLCSQTAELSAMAWDYIHGYLPPRDEKRGAA